MLRRTLVSIQFFKYNNSGVIACGGAIHGFRKIESRTHGYESEAIGIHQFEASSAEHLKSLFESVKNLQSVLAEMQQQSDEHLHSASMAAQTAHAGAL